MSRKSKAKTRSNPTLLKIINLLKMKGIYYSEYSDIGSIGKRSNEILDSDCEFESGMIYVNAKSRSK
jgi:hypothetical protein